VAAVLAEVLRCDNPGTRFAVVQQLRIVGEPATQQLIRLLSDDQPRVRAAAAYCLGRARKTTASVPSLVDRLADTHPAVRREAARALGRIAHGPALVVPALAKMLRDPDDLIRLTAADALDAFGAEAEPAFDELVAVSHDSSRDVRKNRLLELTKDSKFHVRRAAVSTLTALGEVLDNQDAELKLIVSALAGIAHDEEQDKDIRKISRDGLNRVQSTTSEEAERSTP